MKKEYCKPTIHVEVMELDMPVASGCAAEDDYYEFREQGWFISGDDCDHVTDWINDNRDSVGDTVCYHSNVEPTFAS